MKTLIASATAIVDDSTAFDLSQAPNSDIEPSIEDIDLDRLGLFLVHRMMDGAEHQRLGGCNVVTLTKKTTDEGTGTA